MTKTHKTCNAPFGGTIAVHIVTFEVFLEEEKAPANLMDPDVQNHRNLSSYLNVLLEKNAHFSTTVFPKSLNFLGFSVHTFILFEITLTNSSCLFGF